MENNPNYLTSYELLETKLQNVRSEARLHQFKLADYAEKYAATGLKTLILLNAGALSLIPTFIKSFNLSNIDGSILFYGMFSFILSITTTLLSYLTSYLSNYFGALREMELAHVQQYRTANIHYTQLKIEPLPDWDVKIDKANQEANILNIKLGWCAYIGVFMSVCAISLFLFGAFLSIRSLKDPVFSINPSDKIKNGSEMLLLKEEAPKKLEQLNKNK